MSYAKKTADEKKNLRERCDWRVEKANHQSRGDAERAGGANREREQSGSTKQAHGAVGE
jgi:hypothetical protein